MSPEEWEANDSPAAMLAWLRLGRVAAEDDYPPNYPHCPVAVSERKLRLWACGCVRQVWDKLTDERSQRAVETAETYADGRANYTDLLPAMHQAYAAWSVTHSRPGGDIAFLPWAATGENIQEALGHNWFVASKTFGPTWTLQADLLRCVFNPWQPLPKCTCGGDLVPNHARFDCEVGRWAGDRECSMARRIYDERSFEDCPVLADALEEAHCTEAALLAHLRGQGPHCRGCWPIDLLLGEG